MAKNSNDIIRIKNRFDTLYGDKYKQKWNRYIGTYAPINYRNSYSPLKQDSQINISSNFVSEIVDLKTGYLGSKIYQTALSSNDDFINSFNTFIKETSESIKILENIKYASTAGISHRLLYASNGVVKTKVIDPWSVVYDYKYDIYDPDRAYYFYETEDLLGNVEKYCDVYDRSEVTHCMLSGGDYIPLGEPVAHLFNEVPIIPFYNNDQIQGNADKVVDMIDAYDQVLSDYASEIKASRMAYLKIFGDLYTGTDSEGKPIEIPTYLKEFGTFLFSVDDDGKKSGDAEFLQKTLDYNSITEMLSILRKQIFEQSNSVDLSRMIELGSNTRVFTIKTSLMKLEADSSLTERFIISALEKQFRLFKSWFNLYNNKSIDAELHIEFNRSFPEDVEALAQALIQFKQVLSLEDSLKYLGFENAKLLADNANAEMIATSGLSQI